MLAIIKNFNKEPWGYVRSKSDRHSEDWKCSRGSPKIGIFANHTVGGDVVSRVCECDCNMIDGSAITHSNECVILCLFTAR